MEQVLSESKDEHSFKIHMFIFWSIPMVLNFIGLSWVHLVWMWILVYNRTIRDFISWVVRKNIPRLQSNISPVPPQDPVTWLNDFFHLFKTKCLQPLLLENYGVDLGPEKILLSDMKFEVQSGKSLEPEYALDFNLLFPVISNFHYMFKGFRILGVHDLILSGRLGVTLQTDGESNITDFKLAFKEKPSVEFSLSGLISWLLPEQIVELMTSIAMRSVAYPWIFRPDLKTLPSYSPPPPTGLLRVRVLELRGNGQHGMRQLKIRLRSDCTEHTLDIPRNLDGVQKMSDIAEFPYLQGDYTRKMLKFDALDSRSQIKAGSKRIRLSKACKMKEKTLRFDRGQEIMVKFENSALIPASKTSAPEVPRNRFESQAVLDIFIDVLESNDVRLTTEPFIELQVSDQPIFYVPVPRQHFYSQPEVLRWAISKQLLLPVHDITSAKLSIKLFKGLKNKKMPFALKVWKKIIDPLQDVSTKIQTIGQEIWEEVIDLNEKFFDSPQFQWVQMGEGSRLGVKGMLYFCEPKN